MAAIGYAEMGLLQAAIVSSLGSTTAGQPRHRVCHRLEYPDQQAGNEQVQGAALSFLGGACIVGGAGSLGTAGTASLEQMVIDNDIYEYFYRVLDGVDFSEDAVAEELIADLGPGKEY